MKVDSDLLAQKIWRTMVTRQVPELVDNSSGCFSFQFCKKMAPFGLSDRSDTVWPLKIRADPPETWRYGWWYALYRAVVLNFF